MRRVTYGGAVSLDGFLAGADGSIDWLHFSKDVQQVMMEYSKDVDTILMGRDERPTSSRRPWVQRKANAARKWDRGCAPMCFRAR